MGLAPAARPKRTSPSKCFVHRLICGLAIVPRRDCPMTRKQIVLEDCFEDGSGKGPQYDQINTVNAPIEAIAKVRDRIRLLMATGTGKAYTAFQIIWRRVLNSIGGVSSDRLAFAWTMEQLYNGSGLPDTPIGARLLARRALIRRTPVSQEPNMSSKATLISDGLAYKMSVAGIVILSAIVASKPSLAQAASDGATTSIQRGSEAEKALKMQEPSYQTREERLNAKPLDWNSTIGKPKRHALTAAEREALRKARPGSAEGGAPNPNANEEARKLHPDDWK
jgi:hypothetical protein